MLNNYDQEEKWSYYIHCKLSDNRDYRYLCRKDSSHLWTVYKSKSQIHFLSQVLLNQIVWVSLYEKGKPIRDFNIETSLGKIYIFWGTLGEIHLLS